MGIRGCLLYIQSSVRPNCAVLRDLHYWNFWSKDEFNWESACTLRLLKNQGVCVEGGGGKGGGPTIY